MCRARWIDKWTATRNCCTGPLLAVCWLLFLFVDPPFASICSVYRSLNYYSSVAGLRGVRWNNNIGAHSLRAEEFNQRESFHRRPGTHERRPYPLPVVLVFSPHLPHTKYILTGYIVLRVSESACRRGQRKSSVQSMKISKSLFSLCGRRKEQNEHF